MKRPLFSCRSLAGGLIFLVGSAWAQTTMGIFGDASDVGQPAIPGFVFYDSAHATSIITGSGRNIWSTNDEFFYVWTKVSGDVALAANIKFSDSTNHPPSVYRKAALMIRQSLDADSPFVDAVLHGNNLTSIQCRSRPGGSTSEIQARYNQAPAPARLQIVKRGDYAIMNIADEGRPLEPAGGAYKVEFHSPFYVGLAVCAHHDAAHPSTETAQFSEVELSIPPPYAAPLPSRAASTLEMVPIYGGRQIAYYTPNHIESPNWSRDGKFFIFDQNFKLYKLPTNGMPEPINTGDLTRIGGDHGVSPDGKWIALSDHTVPGGARIYIMPIGGGDPRLLTSNAPSYFHSWSPDSKTIAFTGERGGVYDIYTMPADGGPETRLTSDPFKDDGPEFSPDGSKIYFTSDRTGHMQIWRMNTDGSNQEQLSTNDDINLFPHPSPDGRAVVFLSYPPGSNPSHSSIGDITIRLLPLNGSPIRTLGRFYGDEGSLNAPCWSPDSLHVALVSYLPW